MSSGQSRERTVQADGDQFPRQQLENVESRMSDGGEDEFPANKDGGGDAEFVRMLVFFDRDTDAVHHRTGKVIGDQAGPDFLDDERRLFRVEFGEANGILQVTKRGFDAPTAEIELFELVKGEVIRGKIGNERFIFSRREFKTDDAQRQYKETIAAILNEIEGSILVDESDVTIGEREFLGLSADDDDGNRDVELIIGGELNMVQ